MLTISSSFENLELLVSFFRSAMGIIASTGTIIVTLFEGEPYSLWNIRDLARHAGLKVGRSFQFDGDMYPGYAHVRTLGDIEGGGAWKGADRKARTYIFERSVIELGDSRIVRPSKRKHEDSSSDED